MRDSLKRSIADTPATGFERYPAGSIVICNSCAKPIFKLDAPISLGEKGGIAKKFKPITMADLRDLGTRMDIDAGVRVFVALMSEEQRREHLAKLWEPVNGMPMMCPCCSGSFVQCISVERTEASERAYTIELVTIPPSGRVTAIRGKRIGANAGWVH